MTSICELLAESGWQVRALGTTLSESARPQETRALLEGLGVTVERRRRRGAELCYSHRGVDFRTLVVARFLKMGTGRRSTAGCSTSRSTRNSPRSGPT